MVNSIVMNLDNLTPTHCRPGSSITGLVDPMVAMLSAANINPDLVNSVRDVAACLEVATQEAFGKAHMVTVLKGEPQH